MQKIIFLDIDGPVIPTPMYFIDINCSLNFSYASNIAIACLNSLCEMSGAKIVTNTYHNNRTNPSVHEGLVQHGLLKEYLFGYNQSNGKTEFPNDRIHPSRLTSINTWMEENGESDWICFDDANFIDDQRLILVSFDLGITYREYKKALNMWNLKERFII